MATTAVTLNGVTYFVPQPGEKGPTYDQDLTNYLIALATAFPQGGASPSSTFQALISATSLPATAGQIRFAKTDLEEWRNSGNTGNDILGIGAGLGATGTALDELFFQSTNTSGLQQITGQPALHARVTTPVTGISTATTVIFNTVDQDTDSGYNVGTGVYTVPTGKGGWYLITTSLATSQATSTGNQVIQINVAGTVVSFGGAPQVPAAATNVAASTATVVNVTAGQTINVQLSVSAGTCGYLASTGSVFSLKRLV